MYLVIGSLPLLIGLMGPHLVDAGIDHEQFLATVARLHLPGILYIVFAGAVVSAILSTVDSALLASGALASHNILGPLFRLKEERMKTLLARVCVLGSGVIAFVMAISSEGIRDLVGDRVKFRFGRPAGDHAVWIVYRIWRPRRGAGGTCRRSRRPAPGGKLAAARRAVSLFSWLGRRALSGDRVV